MIDPENKIPLDDTEDSDPGDQQSQQDVHSNGIDEHFDSTSEESAPAIDLLQQASDAAEASFTLNVEKGIAPKTDNKEKK
jgi:hypothetical protein